MAKQSSADDRDLLSSFIQQFAGISNIDVLAACTFDVMIHGLTRTVCM